MNHHQLMNWLTARLKEAEPLDRPSDLDDPQRIAIKATKKLVLLGVGTGSLYLAALQVKSPQDCAAVLMDCRVALAEALRPTEAPQPAADHTRPDFLSAGEVAAKLGCSDRSVWRMNSAGELPEPVQLGGMTKWRREEIEAL